MCLPVCPFKPTNNQSSSSNKEWSQSISYKRGSTNNQSQSWPISKPIFLWNKSYGKPLLSLAMFVFCPLSNFRHFGIAKVIQTLRKITVCDGRVSGSGSGVWLKVMVSPTSPIPLAILNWQLWSFCSPQTPIPGLLLCGSGDSIINITTKKTTIKHHHHRPMNYYFGGRCPSGWGSDIIIIIIIIVIIIIIIIRGRAHIT